MTAPTANEATACLDIWKTWRDQMVQNWSATAQQTVESKQFSQAAHAWMDWYLLTEHQMRENVRQMMESLDLPTAEAMARLSSQVASAQTRAVECEDRLDASDARVVALRQEVDSLQKRLREVEQALTAPRSETVRSEGHPVEDEALKSSTQTDIKKRNK